MMTTSDLDYIEYRVALIHPESRELIALEAGGDYRLLRVFVPLKTRYAREVQIAVQRVFKLAVLVVEFLTISEHDSSCVVAELLSDKMLSDLYLVRPDQLPEGELSEDERAHLSRMLADEGTTLVSSIGWIDQAIRWIQDAVGAKATCNADVEQYSAGGGFALVRFPMQDGHTYWLKATRFPNAHERTLTSFLSQLCAPFAPALVTERPEWNAWLMLEEGRPLPSLPTDPVELGRFLGRATKSLAELQKQSARHEQKLLTAGAFDQRLHVMRTHVDMLFAYLEETMSSPTSEGGPSIASSRLQEMRRLLDRVYEHLDQLDFPVTMLHGDINLGNILFTHEGCQFTDWSEGFIGFPFVTLEHLLLLNRVESQALKASTNQTLKEIYCTGMSDLCNSRQIEEGLACAPLLAAVSALYGRGDWLQTKARYDPRRLRYAQRMVRHIDFAAQNPALLETMCV